MGCDAYIPDPSKPVKIVLICYECGNKVDLDNPSRGHELCDVISDGKLKVDEESENFERR